MEKISRSGFFGLLAGTRNNADSGANPVTDNPFANKSLPQFSNRSVAGLEPYSGDFGKPELLHLLRRCMFGPSKADLAHFEGMSLDAVLNELLTASAAPQPPLNGYNSANFTDPDVLPGETWVNAPANNLNGLNPKRRNSLKQWWVGLMLNQDRNLTEKMTLFWHNFLATETVVVGDSRAAYTTIALLRSFALGNFKTLIRQITTDCGMLVYLNGNTNSNVAPNENYGRELQELFTVGRGPDSQYTEADVIAAARVLTGWKINANLTSYFNPAKHDTGDKQFSPFYNNTIIQGQSGLNGAQETDLLIDMLFDNQETARFLARKIYRFFGYYVIESQVETDIIIPLADLLIVSDFEVVPALKTFFKSAHFFDQLNRGCQIKSPVDHIVGVCRQFQVSFPQPANLNAQYKGWDILLTNLMTLGMDPGDPPNVAGWAAYYQEPQFHETWINSNTLPGRNQFTDTLSLSAGLTQGGVNLKFDFIAFTSQLADAHDPNTLIAEAALVLSPNELGPVQTDFLKSILLSDQASDYYWTDAWGAYIADPANQMNFQAVDSRLRSMYQYMLALAEYELI